MNVGDYVIKAKGHHALMTGIVLNIIKSDLGRTYVIVYARGIIRRWSLAYTEVIYEAG